MQKGMPNFKHALKSKKSQAIRAYVIDLTQNTIAFCESDYREQYPELLDTACELPVSAGEQSPKYTKRARRPA